MSQFSRFTPTTTSLAFHVDSFNQGTERGWCAPAGRSGVFQGGHALLTNKWSDQLLDKFTNRTIDETGRAPAPANPSQGHFTGYSREDLLGVNNYDSTVPGWAGGPVRSLDMVGDAFSERRINEVQLRYTSKNDPEFVMSMDRRAPMSNRSHSMQHPGHTYPRAISRRAQPEVQNYIDYDNIQPFRSNPYTQTLPWPTTISRPRV